ncbi:hypothetical protein [Streptomyces sp. NBC_01465]|nr:hypothetical protein [Streptomyces sp. NBC_01465]
MHDTLNTVIEALNALTALAQLALELHRARKTQRDDSDQHHED